MLQTTVDRPLRVYKSKLKAPPVRRRRKPLVPTILLFGLELFWRNRASASVGRKVLLRGAAGGQSRAL